MFVRFKDVPVGGTRSESSPDTIDTRSIIRFHEVRTRDSRVLGTKLYMEDGSTTLVANTEIEVACILEYAGNDVMDETDILRRISRGERCPREQEVGRSA